MNLAIHCTFCNLQKVSFKNGSTCGLTHKKPDFDNICSKIVLKDKFEKEFRSVNTDWDSIKRTKTSTYIHSSIFIVIGLALIACGYLLGKHILDGEIISEGPLTVMGVGIIPLAIAVVIISKHKQKTQIPKSKKDRIDEIIKLYQIDYNSFVKQNRFK